MPRPRAAMRKIREVLRLHEAEHLSARQVGIAVGLPRTTVRHYLDRAREAGLGWPLPDDARRPRASRSACSGGRPRRRPSGRPVPDWAVVHRELRRKGVTLMLLWTEYQRACTRGLPVQPVRRALPGVRRRARRRHAPGASGRREVLRRLPRGRRSRSTDPRHRRVTPGGAVRRGPRAPRNYTYARPCRPRSCRTGSAPTSRPSSSSTGRPRSWSRNMFRGTYSGFCGRVGYVAGGRRRAVSERFASPGGLLTGT